MLVEEITTHALAVGVGAVFGEVAAADATRFADLARAAVVADACVLASSGEGEHGGLVHRLQQEEPNRNEKSKQQNVTI